METQETASMPVILNQSLFKSPIYACLLQHNLKARVSERSTDNSVIFPMSSVAFFYLPVTPPLLAHMDSQQQPDVMRSVDKFVEVHGHCYIIIVSPDLCDKTFSLLTQLQTRYLESRLQVIPVQSAADAASAMIDIAKCRPLSGKMHERFCLLLNRLLLEEVSPRLLAQLGLDTHQQQLVQDGIGSMCGLASASPADLMDCALDGHTALTLTRFFQHGPA